jgi:di/tricarboxylate transporter
VTAAAATLLALIAAIVLSIVSRMNVGLVAIALAFLISLFAPGVEAEAVVRGFPASLFLTLTGVTLLFAGAEANGTLGALARRAVRRVGHDPLLLPVLFFLIAGVVASIGPGSVSTVALMAPLATAMGAQAGTPPFLTALMLANGANAGNLSPLSAVGIIANDRMGLAGVGGHEAKVWFANFAAHSIVSLAVWLWFARRRSGPAAAAPAIVPAEPALTPTQWLTLAVLAGWIVGVIGLQLHVGLSAFGAAVLLVLLRAVDERKALTLVPWPILMMVSGVSVLIGLLEATGGMDLFTSLLARLASPDTVNGVIAFVTGTISIWSSTSGVVLPAFLPTVTDLVSKVGGGDPLAVALSINVGSSLVDVSPLSTLGALCVAAVADPDTARRLFRQLLIWGLSMAVVGAMLAQVLAGPLARL